MNPLSSLLLGLLLGLAALPAWPLASDRNQPIRIESDRLEIDESRRQSSYSGNVLLQQGSLRIQADRIRFIFDDNNDLVRLEIEGRPARLEQTGDDGQPLTGQARNIVYRMRKSLLELSGEARLQNGKDRIESERIRFDIDSNALEAGDPQAKENGRVRMVIQPPAPRDETTPSEPAAKP